MSIQNNNANPLTLRDIQQKALLRCKGEPLSNKINHLSELCEVIRIKLVRDITSAIENNEDSLVFLNFWLLNLSVDEEDNLHVTASLKSTSTSRKVTNKFVENNFNINENVAEYFFSVLSKPPEFMELLKELLGIIKANTPVLSGEITTGAHIAYLINVLFTEILYATYNEDRAVEVDQIGTFVKKAKKLASAKSKEKPQGALHFYPSLTQ